MLAIGFGSCNNVKDEVKPMLVIMDTDMGNGVDDVMALQQLLDYEREGREITVTSSPVSLVPEFYIKGVQKNDTEAIRHSY